MQGTAKHLVYVPLVAMAIMSAGACASDPPPDAEMAGWCNDAADIRVEDDRCGDYDSEGIASNPGFSYVWIASNSNHAVPPIGGYSWQYVDRNQTVRKVQSGKPIAKGLPKTGGQMSAIQRGGFGVRSGTTGGIGAKAGSGAVAGKSGGS